MPLNKPLAEITEADLRALIEAKEPEGKTVDYKRDRVGNSDSDKREFLYDVSSFANASGGHLIFGMEEREGIPIGLPGLAGTNLDQEIGRLEQLARDGIRAPIVGLHSIGVSLANGNAALILRIPKSWNPPHQVTFQKAFRFYGRGSTGKYLLDVDELRSIFSLSEGVAERVQRFRIDRVAKIVAGETPVPLEPGARLILHVVPLSAFGGRLSVEFGPLIRNSGPILGPLGIGGSSRWNVDGFLGASDLRTAAVTYCQAFRNGCVEFVQVQGEWRVRNNVLVLPSLSFEETVLRAVEGCKQLLRFLNIAPPAVLMLTLLGIKGWRMGYDGASVVFQPREFDRDPLFIPDTLLETFEQPPEVDAKPLLDATWNAAGWPRSMYYDDKGNWIGNQRR